MTSSQLPSADAAWLHMDSPANPMVVNAVIWFDEPIDASRAREILGTRLVDEFPRFRHGCPSRSAGRRASRTIPSSTSTSISTGSRYQPLATARPSRSS